MRHVYDGCTQSACLPFKASFLGFALIFTSRMSQPLIAALLALTPPAPNADPNAQKQQMIYQIGMIVVMGVVFWVLLIRPQQKRAKEQASLLSNLKPGDRVTTSSGIVGSVVSIKEHTVTLRSADTKLEVVKSSVSQVLQGSEAPASTPGDAR